MDIPFPSWPRPRRFGLGRLRVQLTYLWRHGRLADLVRPRRFTEFVQHRKLFDRDPALPELADKVAAKAAVARTIGRRWVVPTLWKGEALPADPAWPTPFVVKSRHGCGHVAIVRDGGADWAEARERSRRWMRRRYGGWLDEWLYGQIPMGLLVEPYIGRGPALPLDFKLFVFGGVVRYVQVHLDRATRHRWIVFDLDWRRVSGPSEDPDPVRPATLALMIEAAEALACDRDFVRVDFYEVDGRPLFGEMTFYPGSGLEPFDPPSLDLAMGEYWRAAVGRPGSGPARIALGA